MIKVFKISSHILSTIIIIVVVIPMVLSLVLQSGRVQTWIVGKAAQYISTKIDSKVSIGRIDIGKFYNVKIYDFYVQSKLGRDTLLYAKKLTTRLSAFNLKETDLSLAMVKINGGEFNLYAQDTLTNVKEILDRIRGDAPKKKDVAPFKMAIGSIQINDFTFRYQKKDPEIVPYGINYQDLELQQIHIDLDNFRLIDDSIQANVDKISLREKGGVNLNKLSLDKLIISSSVMNFSGGDVVMDDSTYLKFKSVKISYNKWEMQDFINTIPISADITESHIALSTIAKFTKQLRNWKSVASFNGTFDGTVSSMQGHINEATISETKIINTDYYIHGITDINNAIFDFTFGKLTTKPNDVVAILSDFSTSGETLLPKEVVGNSTLTISGFFLGKVNNFDAVCNLSTDDPADGSIKSNLNLKILNKNLFIDGSIVANQLNTQKLYNNNKLKSLTATIYTKGMLNKENSSITVKGDVASLYFDGYNYNHILLNGDLVKKSFAGYVGCTDPNLDFEFNGLIDFSNNLPSYNFHLDLKQVDLHAIGLNKRDTTSLLSGRIMADGYGDKIDNLDATIVIDNLKYINQSDTTIAENEIRIESYNDDNSKSLNVFSEYLDLTFKGVHSYGELFNFIKKSSRRYIPALKLLENDKTTQAKNIAPSTGNADDYYVITLDVKKANNLANIFVPSLTLAEDSKLSFIFNPSADSFSLNVSSKYIILKDYMIYNISADSKNEGDKVNFFVRAEEVYLGNVFLPNFSIFGSIENDKVTTDFGFSNSEDKTYAVIKTKTLVSSVKDDLVYKISMLPSTLNLYRDAWKSDGGEITIDKNKITIDNYNLVSTNQSLHLNGVISESPADSIRMTFHNFSLKPIGLIASKMGFDIDGVIDGEIVGSALKSKRAKYANADLSFKNNSVNGIKIPDGHFYTSWDRNPRTLKFNFESNGEKFIWGKVNTENDDYLANVKIPKFNVALITPFLAGIAGDIVGTADVDVTLSNPKKYLSIDGEVDIPSLDATILPTNARYNISGKAKIDDNQYKLTNGVIKDSDGGNGVLTASMTNDRYKKVNYQLGIKANKLLGLNTTDKDNNQFYGKAYASGNVSIKGDRNRVILSVDATSSKRSTFFLPLGGRMLSEVSFIKFAAPVADNDRRTFLKEREANKNTTSFEMKMHLTATPLLETEIVMDPLTGSSIKATGNGLIDIDIQPANEIFTINGEYTLDKGTYRFILPNFNLVDKYFSIKEGSWIRWAGDPLNATLNVNAIYNLKASLAPLLGNNQGTRNRVGVDCILALRGELVHPDITLGIEVPDAGPEEQSLLKSVLNTQEAISTQLFFLLFTNSFYATSNATGNTGNIGLMGTTTTGIEFLTNQIKNIFSSDKFDFGINYHPYSDLSSNEFGFDISAPILNNKLYIDVAGNYNFMDNATANTSNKSSNWSGDVYITWLLNSSGNLSLKGFTKTIDTFDENQGLQDSGVGIYFKSDFDTFKDLKMRYRQYIKRRKENRLEKREKKNEKKTNSKNKTDKL